MTGEKSQNIVFGKGIFKIDNAIVGLTRDGGNFSVEYEYREINADGDRGKVKGRVVKEGARPKLTINHLELLTDLSKFHPGVTDSSGTVTCNGKVATTDYHDVEFVGETKDGRTVTIKVEDAINVENISWDLKEKDDIVDSVTFEGTYDPTASDAYAEPWSIVYTPSAA